MSKKNLVFFIGINDDRKITVNSINEDQAFNFIYNGYINISEQINIDNINIHKYIIDTNRNQKIRFTHPIDLVFNAISDPDSHKISLEKVQNISNQLSNKNICTLNEPKYIQNTTRDNIYNQLKNISNLTVPKTIKITANNPKEVYDNIKKNKFEFPVIFRQAGDHGGVSTILLENSSEQFYSYCLNGKKQYYLTQYIDCKRDNIYSKYRLIVIDGEVFLRHIIQAKEWMVHAPIEINDKKMKKTVANNFEKKIKPKIKNTIEEIYKILKLEYFGIDCDIDENGKLIIFEINANMNIFADIDNSLFSKQINKAIKKLNLLIRSKL